MKKTIFTIFSFILVAQMAFAGGIVTNTNQSASWVRMMARDASVDVDAVFFNPAGLTHLDDGFYFQLNSQTVSQTRTVTSTFPGLNNSKYTGETFVPFLPTAFAVYKKGKFAISGGFTVIGGGGSAEFDKGLPDFEYGISQLPAALSGVGAKTGANLTVNGYEVDQYLKGSSSYLGFQGAFSYKINDVISVALGARYVLSKNNYDGYIKSIMFDTPNGLVNGVDFMNSAKPVINGLATKLTSVTKIPDLLNPYLNDYGSATLDQAKPILDQLDPSYYPNLVAAGRLVGLSDPSKFTIKELNDKIVASTPEFNKNIAQLNGLANADLSDKALEVEQTGSGFTPFVSVDFDLGSLGFSAKYEMKTNMKVKTKVINDDFGLFKDGEEVPAEMPAMLALGARYNTGGLKFQTGFHYYFDKAAKYGKRNANGEFVTNGEEVNINGDKSYLSGNSIEFAIGAQYDINSMFGLSAGFLMTKTHPNSIYQTSLSYSLPTKTFGFGAIIHATSKIDIDLGASFTSYDKYEKDFTAYKETYEKSAKIFAIGATLKL